MNSYPPPAGPGGLCTEERTHQRGTLSLGGSLEPRCLREIFTCIRHAGARQAPGGWGAFSPSMVTPGPSLGLSNSVQFVGFYLQTGGMGRQVQGCG